MANKITINRGFGLTKEIQNYTDLVMLTKLGMRARERRIVLGLSIAEMARKLGVRGHNFRLWEQRLYIDPRPQLEYLWEQELRVPTGWLRNWAIEAHPLCKQKHVYTKNSKTVSEELTKVANWLANPNPFSRSTSLVGSSETTRRDSFIFCLRYGLKGQDIKTYDAISRTVGISRERVRNIFNEMKERKAGVHFDIPVSHALYEKYFEEDHGESEFSFSERRNMKLGGRLSISDALNFAQDFVGESPKGILRGATPVVSAATLL